MPYTTVVLLLLAGAGVVHQRLFCGEWFSWSQFWHHEPLIAICVALGLWEVLRKIVRRRVK